MLPTKILPVIWNYNYDDILGSAVVEPDGSIIMKLTDPRIVDVIKKDLLRGLSISHEPAISRKET